MIRRQIAFSLALACPLVAACASTLHPAAEIVPERTGWRSWESSEAAGWDDAGLAAARQRADEVGSAAVMVVEGGLVVAAWGDIERPLELYSVRKSVYAALYGVAVDRGLVDLEATLSELGVDDRSALTLAEQDARLLDLLAARSGVYHPAAYATSQQDEQRPERGAHPPGTHWFYNNWDFNVAGALLERLADRELGELTGEWLAKPTGMQDFAASDVFAALEPSRSQWPALTLRMSTRDLARFGLLWARRGHWGDRQVIPERWVVHAERPLTTFDQPGQGYGLMWWTYEPGSLSAERYPHLRPHRILVAQGNGGQVLLVLPELDLVLLHRGDTDHPPAPSEEDGWAILDSVMAARRGGPEPGAGSADLRVTPFVDRPAPFDWPEAVQLSPTQRARWTGRWSIAPGVEARIHLHDGRLFGQVPGRAEAELFAVSPEELFTRLDAGTRVRLLRGEEPSDDRIVLWAGDRRIEARRVGE